MDVSTDKWHLRYLGLAKHISEWSKDRTKIGAVAVGKHGQILSQGYNGFPRKVPDYHDRIQDREKKLKYTIHAEMNCIYNASLSGVSLYGSTFYVYGLPICSECAKGVIQSGVSMVVSAFNYDLQGPWQDSWKLSQTMMDEAEVYWRTFDIKEVK